MNKRMWKPAVLVCCLVVGWFLWPWNYLFYEICIFLFIAFYIMIKYPSFGSTTKKPGRGSFMKRDDDDGDSHDDSSSDD